VFHATACFASGGVMLSGDDLSKISPDRMAILEKLVPPTGVAGEVEDDLLRVGRAGPHVCVFTLSEVSETTAFRAGGRGRDFWSGENLGSHGQFRVELGARSARLFEVA